MIAVIGHGDVGRGLLRSLPPLLMLRPARGDSLHQIIELISDELTEPAPGQQIALDRLLDLLVVFALRAAFQHGPTSPRWFQAARDPRLGPALHAIHSKPETPWTVPQLASLSGFSRLAFARNFEQALGQSAMRYLTEWRMTLARDYLRMDELSITEIAQRVDGRAFPATSISGTTPISRFAGTAEKPAPAGPQPTTARSPESSDDRSPEPSRRFQGPRVGKAIAYHDLG